MRWHRVLGIGILLASLGGGAAWYAWRGFEQTPLRLPDTGLVIRFEPGSSVTALARDLAAQGVLEHPWMLRLLARLRGWDGRLRAGEYRIPAGTRPGGLLRLLTRGQVLMHPLTLVEGRTFGQYLADLRAADFLDTTLDGLAPAQIMLRLGHPGESPEGRFFPDTYLFPRGASDLDVLRRAYTRMSRVLAAEWAARAPDLPLKDPYEALILASIVEKETGRAAERPLIAGVFIRRLRRGMRLQTDPTVIYGLGEAFDGDLRRADLLRDTPYNTYVHGGLPPTPIAMPGRAAIHAVLHPAPGRALYFVARGDGSHQFSATLEGHRRAVRRYQLQGGAGK